MKIIVLGGIVAAVLIAGVERYRGAPISLSSTTYSASATR